ncbi:hypothetical protein BHE74_00016822 [Ensete ventricosum]|uniref:Uncharacterized protein n=1 Tax=Ensete ventricosum TaxID=4639 RepID=A0A444FW30_ENSVE|nr:hypothetical protein GW17_00008775 [Ensete ventricosum]RWW75164.1 hypothetical protein BHE74_00016822 [Ensete ventricosum]RZR73497.1 hypothetical protein BHM03_00024991 [Ensete ventricosum]
MKVQEWWEMVAGPLWKTVIRRFNCDRHHHGGGYDLLSYALNFDGGHGREPQGELHELLRLLSQVRRPSRVGQVVRGPGWPRGAVPAAFSSVTTAAYEEFLETGWSAHVSDRLYFLSFFSIAGKKHLTVVFLLAGYYELLICCVRVV